MDYGQFNWGDCLLKSNKGLQKIISQKLEIFDREQNHMMVRLKVLLYDQGRKSVLVNR